MLAAIEAVGPAIRNQMSTIGRTASRYGVQNINPARAAATSPGANKTVRCMSHQAWIGNNPNVRLASSFAENGNKPSGCAFSTKGEPPKDPILNLGADFLRDPNHTSRETAAMPDLVKSTLANLDFASQAHDASPLLSKQATKSMASIMGVQPDSIVTSATPNGSLAARIGVQLIKGWTGYDQGIVFDPCWSGLHQIGNDVLGSVTSISLIGRFQNFPDTELALEQLQKHSGHGILMMQVGPQDPGFAFDKAEQLEIANILLAKSNDVESRPNIIPIFHATQEFGNSDNWFLVRELSNNHYPFAVSFSARKPWGVDIGSLSISCNGLPWPDGEDLKQRLETASINYGSNSNSMSHRIHENLLSKSNFPQLKDEVCKNGDYLRNQHSMLLKKLRETSLFSNAPSLLKDIGLANPSGAFISLPFNAEKFAVSGVFGSKGEVNGQEFTRLNIANLSESELDILANLIAELTAGSPFNYGSSYFMVS